MPVILLECPAGVAEEAVVALHAKHVVVVIPAVPSFEDTTQSFRLRARKLVGAVGECAFCAKATLRGFEPVLADLSLIDAKRWLLNLALEHNLLLIAIGRRHEAWLLGRVAGSEIRDESWHELRRGRLEGGRRRHQRFVSFALGWVYFFCDL